MNIGNLICDFAGNPLPNNLTVKDCLLNLVGAMQSKTGKEAIQLNVLGQKIYAANGIVDLTEEEKKFVEMAIDQNAPKYVALVLGQVASCLKN